MVPDLDGETLMNTGESVIKKIGFLCTKELHAYDLVGEITVCYYSRYHLSRTG